MQGWNKDASDTETLGHIEQTQQEVIHYWKDFII